MSAPHFATVPDVEPVVELGIGSTFADAKTAGRWDVSHWDDTDDAYWSGVEPGWVDVTCDVRSVDTTVGHDRTLDAWDVGTCTVVVDNASGWADLVLDPLDPEQLDLRPGRAIRWGIRRTIPGYVIPGTPAVDAYLDPTIGNASTVDTTADRLHGTVRLRSRFRWEGTLTQSALIAMQRATGASNIAWDWYVRYTDVVGIWRVSSSGTALEQSTAVIPAGGLVPGVDLYAGARWENGGKGTVTAGEQSTNAGASWHDVSTNTRTPLFTAYDSTAPITVGGAVTGGAQRLPGRIFWAQMEQLNRARIVFDGSSQGVSIAGAGAWPDPLRIEMRVTMTDPDATLGTGDWPTFIGRRTTSATPNYDLMMRRASAQARNVQLHWYDGAGASQTFLAPTPWAAGAIAANTPVWFRVTFTATTVSIEYNTAQTYDPPASGWVSMGSGARPGAAGFTAAQAAQSVRLGQTTSSPYPWRGRVVRALVRNNTTLAVMLDVQEDDAWPGRVGGATPGAFTASSGHACTTAGSVNPIQAQPDAVIWRFDASEYPGTGTSYVDPRGRTWTLSAAGAIKPKVPAVPDVVVPPVTVTTYRFRGFIDAMRAEYAGPNIETDTAVLDCIDALGEVSRVQLAQLATPVGVGETADERLNRILDLAGWRTEARDIAPSSVPMLGTDLGAQTADLLGQVADSAGGALFGDYLGRVAFRGRDWQTWMPDAPPDLIIGNTAEAAVCPSTIEVSFPRAGTTTRSLVNYEGATTPPVQRDDLDAQLLYGIETTPERLDLQTADPTQLDSLADRLLATRGVGTMPRITSLTLDAGRDEATMLAMLTADPQRPSRWRLVIERDGRPVLDRMLLVTAITHSWDASSWRASVRLDDAMPWAAAGGRWDGATWDGATWAAGTDLDARLGALLAALQEVPA